MSGKEASTQSGTWYSINEGKFKKKVEKETEGAIAREWETPDGKSGIKYELHYNALFGKIEGIKIVEGEYGQQVVIQLDEDEAVHTVDGVYDSACWFERETYDMYGIVFAGSKDSRRILTDYNFEGFPLRKDFPLTGNVEVHYDPIKGEVVYAPVSLAQDYRDFDFKSNWIGKK